MGPPLQCFNPELYAPLHACDRVPYQCIAPTAKFTRCRWDISSEAQREADRLRRKAETLPEGQERHEVICRFVLLHCCAKWHSWKLEADTSGCLDEVAYDYGAGIAVPIPQPTQITPPQLKAEPEPIPEHLGIKEEEGNSDADIPASDTVHVSHNMELRPRLGSDGLPRRIIPRDVPVFVPYISDPYDSLRVDLLAPVPFDWTRSGQIYTFTWPSHPGYVKIGYTGYSSVDRVDAWRACHPGATLQRTFTSVEYPERIERLIHLQMRDHRHRISICARCQTSHQEWFKLDLDQVHQIMNDWVQLCKRMPLYDHGRNLTKEWSHRIKGHVGEITARGLLDLLDAELIQSRPSAVIPKLVSEVNTVATERPTSATQTMAKPSLPTSITAKTEAIKEEEKVLPAVQKLYETPPATSLVTQSETKAPIAETVKLPKLASDQKFSFTFADVKSSITDPATEKQRTTEDSLSVPNAIEQFSKFLSFGKKVEEEKPTNGPKDGALSPSTTPRTLDTFSFSSPYQSSSFGVTFADSSHTADQPDAISSAIARFSTFTQLKESPTVSVSNASDRSGMSSQQSTTESPIAQNTVPSVLTSPLNPVLAIAAQAAVGTLAVKIENDQIRPSAALIGSRLLHDTPTEMKDEVLSPESEKVEPSVSEEANSSAPISSDTGNSNIKVIPSSTPEAENSAISAIVTDLKSVTLDDSQNENEEFQSNDEETTSFDAGEETFVDDEDDSGVHLEDEDTIVVNEAIDKESIIPIGTAAKEIISTLTAVQALKTGDEDMYSFLADFMRLQMNTPTRAASKTMLTMTTTKEGLALPDVPAHEPLTLPEVPIASPTVAA